MDPIEIKINDIHDIELISFRDITFCLTGAKTDDYELQMKDSDVLEVPMLTVFFNGPDGIDYICLTSLDKHFNAFVKKVREVYLKEKDRPIPGHLFSTFISIDDYSKRLLLSDSITKTSDLYSFYKEKTGYEEPFISKEKEMFGLLPLINYIIDTNLLIRVGKRLEAKNIINGYGPAGKYVLFGDVDGSTIPFLIQVIKMNNNNIVLEIGNVFGELNPLIVNINLNKTSFDIICEVPKSNYKLEETYKYDNGKMICSRRAFIDGESRYFAPSECEKKDNEPSLSKLDEDDKLDWFELPWGANLGFKYTEDTSKSIVKVKNDKKAENNDLDTGSEEKDVPIINSIATRKIQYIDVNDNVFVNLESAEKRLIRQSSEFRLVKDIVYDDVDKTMVGYKDNDLTFIATIFGDDGAVGEYKEKYAGRCFYHISPETDFNKLNNKNIYPVREEFGIFGQSDLLDSYKLKNLIKGS